jgi:hypothetical protein
MVIIFLESDILELLNLIKKAAVSAVEANNPTSIAYGKVISIAPLSIQIDQKLILPEVFLIVPEYLTEKKITISEPEYASGGGINIIQKEYIIREALKVNDNVILIKCNGGQKYIILDRV